MSRFRNAICHALGKQLKVCTLTKVYCSERCSGASGLIVATKNGYGSEKERARSETEEKRQRA